MQKKYFYLAGLHRSGNTLLSALLNQHPEVYSSRLSPVLDYAFAVRNNFLDNEADVKYEGSSVSQNVISGLLHSYHKDVDKPIIFDRNKLWCTHQSVDLIKSFIDPKPKILFTTRNFLEIAESAIKVNCELLDEAMNSQGFIWDHGLSLNDNRANYLFNVDGVVLQYQFFLHAYSLPENKDIFHVVKYNDLIADTQNVMDGIYDFFEIDKIKNNLDSIVLKEKENDEALGLPKDMHKVYPTIESNKSDPKNFFSDYVLEKYKHLDGLIK